MILSGAALLLCVSANATADLGARAEVRAGVFAGYDEEQPPAASFDLLLRPQAVLGGRRPNLDGQLSYTTDLRLRALGLAVIPFSTHNFVGALGGGREAGGVRFRLNANLSLGQVSFDPLAPEGQEQPSGLAAIGQGVAVPFTSSSVGASLAHRPARRWRTDGNASGRLFFVPLLDENGEVIQDRDPEVRLGPDVQASLSHDLTREDVVGLRARGETIFGPAGLIYSAATLTAGYGRDVLPFWPLNLRVGAVVTKQLGFDAGVLPVADLSLTARFPAGVSATASTGVDMGYDAFNDAGAYSTNTTLAVSRSVGRALSVTASGSAFYRLIVFSQRDATGDDLVAVGRLAGVFTVSDNLFFESGLVLSSRYRALDGRNVVQGQVFVAAQGGAGWDS